MLITNRKINYLPLILFNGNSLEWVDRFNYLGLNVEYELHFHYQSLKVNFKKDVLNNYLILKLKSKSLFLNVNI